MARTMRTANERPFRMSVSQRRLATLIADA
jgi:hypothetical protein